jgi:hypothetical protein
MEQHRDYSHEQDDATLVASVLAVERDAFDVLLQRYESSVQRLCTTLLGTTAALSGPEHLLVAFDRLID